MRAVQGLAGAADVDCLFEPTTRETHLMRIGLRAKSLAAVSLLAIATAAPAVAQNVTVTGITSGDNYQLSVPTVEATNTNLTEAQIRRLFTGDFATNASSLAELDAGSITIPELTVSYDVPKTDGSGGSEKAVVTYRDFALTDVVDGVAKSAVVGSAEIDGGAGIKMTFGKMSTSTLDIGAILAFYGLGTPGAADVFKTMYADFAFDGASMTGPGFSCDIGSAGLAEFKARPLKTDFNEFAQLAASVDESETPTPATIRKFIDFYIDILTAFESTPMTGEGFNCSGDDGKGSTVTVASGPIEVGGFTPGIYPHFGVSDVVIDVKGKDAGSVTLGSFTWKQMDFSAPIAALAAAPAELTEAWFTENWRTLIPAIDGLSLTNLKVDAPDPENAGQRIAATVGGFDISLADYVNGIPSKIGLTTQNILVTIPDEDEGKMLRALGIEQVDLSQDLQLHWDKTAQTIVVDNLAIDAAQFGSVKLSAVLGNATDALFAADNNVALVASMGLTLKQLKIDLDDRGISSLIIGVAAAEEKQDPAVMRVGIAGLAQAMVLGLIGTTPEAMAASEEIATFIKTKPQVSVTLSSTDPQGIALPLLMAASNDPSALAGQIAISATSSGDARPADQPVALPTPTTTEEPSDDAAAAVPDDGVQSETQTSKGSLKN